jgi:hypothetical protein
MRDRVRSWKIVSGAIANYEEIETSTMWNCKARPVLSMAQGCPGDCLEGNERN